MANWEIDIWKKLRTEKEAAIAHYLSTVEGKNFVLSSLIEEVADNYYELLALDNQLDIISNIPSFRKKHWKFLRFRNRRRRLRNWLLKSLKLSLLNLKLLNIRSDNRLLRKKTKLMLCWGDFRNRL